MNKIKLDTVKIIRFGHWACGWIDTIMINPIDTKAVEQADWINSELKKYPLFDDNDYSQKQTAYALDAWKWYSLRDKIDLCVKAGLSIFAARHEKTVYEPDIYEHLIIDA
jgi:hypothetical protein